MLCKTYCIYAKSAYEKLYFTKLCYEEEIVFFTATKINMGTPVYLLNIFELIHSFYYDKPYKINCSKKYFLLKC